MPLEQNEVLPDDPPAGGAQAIVQGLYARTAELGIKNKILSLLGQLYDASIQILSPEDLAARLTRTLQADLSCELVAVFICENDGRSVRTLAVAQSERFAAAASAAGADFSSSAFSTVSSPPFATCIVGQHFSEANSLAAVWGSTVTPEADSALREGAHARAVMLYPLIGGGKVIGVLVLVLNRTRDQLSELEHVLFDSAANVVTVAFDKALLYEALEHANEELRNLSQFKSQLLSLASHQIKAPLAAIKGYLGLVQEGGYGPVPENLEKPLHSMRRSADGLVDLVMSLLDFRKIDEGKMEYDFEQVDLNQLVQDVVEELGMLAQEKKLNLTLEGAGRPVHVRADKTKLRQVAQNLVDNAIKYTPSGEVRVKLEVGDRHATCSVTDTGLGMARDLLPRLFDEFTRDHRVQHTIRGTGLGLYIAKRIMEAHGGSIEADSPGEGQGSKFWFTLPTIQ